MATSSRANGFSSKSIPLTRPDDETFENVGAASGLYSVPDEADLFSNEVLDKEYIFSRRLNPERFYISRCSEMC